MSLELVELGEIATVVAGQSPLGSTYNETGVGLPFFQGKADFGDTHPTPKKWCIAPRKVAEAGDILISVRAPVGPTNVASEKCCIGRGLAAIRPDEKVATRDFVLWTLKQREAALVAKANGSTFLAIGQKDLKSLRVPVPSLDEQRRIVSILNRVAKVERLQDRAEQALSEFVPSLFVRMFGDPLANPSGWRRARLGDLCDVQGGLQVTKRRAAHPLAAPYLRVANVLRDELVLDEIKSIRLTARELGRVRLQTGDLLVVEGHGNPAEVGRVAVWDGSIANCVHQNHLIRARPDESVLLPSFASAYLNSSSGRRHLLREAKTTSGLNTITTSSVNSCPIVTPPIELQTTFASLADEARRLATQAESARDMAATLSKSLLSKLLAGGG